MKILFFKCTLLTDIVLNQKAATEGNQKSLDFIPGSNFLGIAAGALYNNVTPAESLTLFHSGNVRFGDAHPEKEGKRTLRIPASMYKPKLDNKDGLYIHHQVKDTNDREYLDFQPKQCRTGFYLIDVDAVPKVMAEVKVDKSFAIKSAYDRDKRRSEDEKMFGYESLRPGSTWLFEVTMDDDTYAEQITSALTTGEKRIGRSRTAQYGLVKIDPVKPEKPDAAKIEPQKSRRPLKEDDKNFHYMLIYADSRLIFLDKYGLPTFQPDPKEDLGIDGGEIIWKYSQIRTFQYAPWNFKRQARDADRCGIEKGSVLYVKVPSETEISSERFVGAYQNEGFGKILINPDFLNVDPELKNGLALYKVIPEVKKPDPDKTPSTDPLFVYLEKQKAKAKVYKGQKIFEKVNKFVTDYRDKYTKESFASQWGTIRSIAVQYKTRKDILIQIFGTDQPGRFGDKNDELKIKDFQNGYVNHGVAAEKWSDNDKRNDFKTFIEQFDEIDFQSAIVNLSAEMAKTARRK
jgi:hypothetical protein